MDIGELTVVSKEVIEELVFSYKRKTEHTFYYISHPETGSVLHKTVVEDNDMQRIGLEGLNNGFYNLVIVDGDTILSQQFEKVGE